MSMSPEDVLQFWMGPLAADGSADPTHVARWFTKDPAFDAAIRERFGATWRAIMDGELTSWCDTPRGRLAYVIVLDQFSRNMFRDTPGAFAADSRALAAAREGIALGHDRQLRPLERTFLYMPFMHSEDLATQEECVALFTRLRDEEQGPLREGFDQNVAYAERHRDIVARWGRFPHRNAQLGRPSTAEEIAFLKEPNSSF